jgi:N-acetyl-anhydromuramyl-L-alanine amidase AmpD
MNDLFKTTFKPTPNISAGRTIKPTAIVLHHAAGSFAATESWILDPRSRVSYHYLINTGGQRTQFAKPNQRAWHAGLSEYKGRKNCNDFTIGISFTGDTNLRELTNLEVSSCVLLIRELWAEFGKLDITTHREISPGRKNDVDLRAEKRIIDLIYLHR